jgi:DnaJ-class molecular chaperone
VTDGRDLLLLIQVLQEALRQWKCPSCGGSKVYPQKGWVAGVFVSQEVPCKICAGTGLHPIASEALGGS